LKYIFKQIIKFILPGKLWVALRAIHYDNQKRRVSDLIPTLKSLEIKNSPKYVVSLTSYGKRLVDTAPYAIITLFNQSVKPDKIILWVAYEDRGNIPEIMNNLVEKGLEIRFCEDIKSYKKLIPSLEAFPEDYIVTADDDIYYPRDWFEQLLTEHNKSPQKIICHRTHGIRVDENHNPIPYDKWDFCIDSKIYSEHNSFVSQCMFPIGSGGILYPPKCFHEDITNKELFMRLAPYADDIWFWAMAVLNKRYFGEKSPYVVVRNDHGYSWNLLIIEPDQEIDGNALYNYNLHGGNDKQFKAMIEQYPKIKEVLTKIRPHP